MNELHIRRAEERDLPALMEIYNYEVVNGVATLDLHPKDLADRKRWLEAHNVENHPLIVCLRDGVVAGYASLSPYREKEAYRSTVELSVYVHPDHRRRGVAMALMEAILTLAREDAATHNVVSVITAGNEASLKLHRRFGFTYCGCIPQVGFKLGQSLDIVNYSLLV